MTGKGHVGDFVILDLQLERDLVAAERVAVVIDQARRVEMPEVARVFIVIEDLLGV